MPSDVARHAQHSFRALTRERASVWEMAPDILRAQIAVTGIAAPTGGEARRARWMAGRFRALGLHPRMDSAGNVIARLAGRSDGGAVAVCAHLDTVLAAEGSTPAERDGPRVVAPGISDNGRGLAAMLAVARALGEWRALDRPVDFVATTGEEGAGDLRGAKHYFAGTTPPFAVIAVDGAGDERVVNGALGSRRFRISFAGPGGHSWSAFGTANPIHAAGHATASLASARLPRDGNTTVTVSRIGGGHAVNAIPEGAWLEVDARSTSAASLARVEQELRAIAAAAAQRENSLRRRSTPEITVGVERIGDRPAGATAEHDPLVRAALEATRLVGRGPALATASTDANAAIGLGIPAIAIGGGGRGGDTHTTREWFDATDASVGVERALTLVATMATLPS